MRTPEQRHADVLANGRIPVDEKIRENTMPLQVLQSGLAHSSSNGTCSGPPAGIFFRMVCDCGCGQEFCVSFTPEQVNRLEAGIKLARDAHPLIFQ